MLKKILLGAAAIAATLTTLPASAEAHGRKHRGHGYSHHDGHYRDGHHRKYPKHRRAHYPRSYYSTH